MNWVKTKLALEAMEPGQRLELLLDAGDAIQGVPRSVRGEGHRVLEVAPLEDGFRLLVERAASGDEQE
jgi:tRNA 2-thiouridine synthesizing protein A